jgi:hypothetical protein
LTATTGIFKIGTRGTAATTGLHSKACILPDVKRKTPFDVILI